MTRLERTRLFGSVDRRSFLAGGAALGLVAGSAKLAFGNVPKAGGHLRLGIGAGETADNLDPAIVNNQMIQVVSFSLRNCLVEIGYDGEPLPELAESWDAGNSAKTWSFKLREGIEFHDGKPFTAADALYSIEYHRNEHSKSVAKTLLDVVDSVKIDGSGLLFELKEGSADFPYVLADYHLHMVPEGQTNFDNGMGTGAYILESFLPGEKVEMRKNPNYWKAGRGHFDTVEVRSIKDFVARQSALISGQVDLIDNIAPQSARLMQDSGNIVLQSINGAQHFALPMLVDTPPFDNVDVRTAVKLAVDRQDFLDRILGGYGRIGNDQPVSPANRFYNPDLPQREYDPDQAKFLLKKAGMENLKVKLHASDVAYAGAIDSAVLYQQYAAKAGIDIEVVREPGDGYWSNVWLKKPWCTTVWYGRPTEDWLFTLGYAKGAEWNDTHWVNDRFEVLLKEARAELDENRRREMYYEMQALVRDDGGAVIPVFADYLQAHNGTVAADRIASNYPLDGFRITERWWRA